MEVTKSYVTAEAAEVRQKNEALMGKALVLVSALGANKSANRVGPSDAFGAAEYFLHLLSARENAKTFGLPGQLPALDYLLYEFASVYSGFAEILKSKATQYTNDNPEQQRELAESGYSKGIDTLSSKGFFATSLDFFGGFRGGLLIKLARDEWTVSIAETQRGTEWEAIVHEEKSPTKAKRFKANSFEEVAAFVVGATSGYSAAQ